jgi:hypothetical protein
VCVMELYCALEELQCALEDFFLRYGVMFCIGLVILRLMGLRSRCGCYGVLKQHGEKLSTYKADWKGCKYTFVHKEICKGN